jgi:hypothetical protein
MELFSFLKGKPKANILKVMRKEQAMFHFQKYLRKRKLGKRTKPSSYAAEAA